MSSLLLEGYSQSLVSHLLDICSSYHGTSGSLPDAASFLTSVLYSKKRWASQSTSWIHNTVLIESHDSYQSYDIYIY